MEGARQETFKRARGVTNEAGWAEGARGGKDRGEGGEGGGKVGEQGAGRMRGGGEFEGPCQAGGEVWGSRGRYEAEVLCDVAQREGRRGERRIGGSNFEKANGL